MILGSLGLLGLSPRAEGWMWWLIFVAVLILVFLLISLLRRRFLPPMDHKPSNVTDAWTEAGRRFTLRPDPDDKETPDDEDAA